MSVDGTAPQPLLIPIGNSLFGCPAAMAPRRLQSTTSPFLGVACWSPNSIACDRVGVGVNIDAATLVMVDVFFQDGTVGTLTGRGFLHAGFG